MTENIWLEGIELVRVKRLLSADGGWGNAELLQFKRAVKYMKDRGVTGVRYDEDGLMICGQGAVYALHGGAYVTQEKVDSVRR